MGLAGKGSQRTEFQMCCDGGSRRREFHEPGLKVSHAAYVVILTAELGVRVLRRDNVSHQTTTETSLIDEPPIIQNHRSVGQMQ